jgi:predicted nucleic acid-binding protein
MVLVDTNILVYLLIEGDRTPQAQALWRRDPQWCSEPFALIEFSNVLATYLRAQALTRAEASALLAEASRRLHSRIEVNRADALELAAERGISAYDARFIAAAVGTGLPLITEDTRLRAAVPDRTLSLAEVLAR